ncbi:DoxX family protein [Microtetraspora sp. AC03309]|uniref:DoxX family protein n=1 Tax=Microtetraspora sp. AC03309 TaxID=2779376 RepID=UPI001E42E235|nr:DoxX family protein [Microtetraspora sp. AC03309]MCC5576318.1 DoxX family protein [Microtetraspora sp. AC03309]
MLERIRPLALLIGRVGIGVVFLVHGWQKFTTMGLSGTTAFFEQIGVPLPGLAGPAVAVLEVAGGLALILGAALPLAGTLLALDMVGAIVFVHGANGFTADKGGYEFVLTLAVSAVAIGFSGGGSLALDALWQRRRTPAAL